MKPNITAVSLDATARTTYNIANQRAANLFILHSQHILELCVGPSLETLEAAYDKYSMECWGNDIDPRWKKNYQHGKWLIGDCFNIDYTPFDTVVFAPPLSVGCTGRREDSLSIHKVTPSYYDFLDMEFEGIKVLVLPGRAIATRDDRNQYYRLLEYCTTWGNVMQIPLVSGTRQIRKYIDIYIIPR